MSPKALLFDMDGTMVDNMDYHLKAWEKMIGELGGGPTGDELFLQMYGKPVELLTRIYGEGRFTIEEMERIGVVKEGYYRDMYRPHVALIPGLKEFLSEAKARNLPMAIGTASNRPNIDLVLDSAGLQDYFSCIVSADDVTHSKPDPETWLKAAAGLDRKPEDCIVFEDVPKGVEAARRAGMACVVVTTHHPAGVFSEFNNVILAVPDFSRLNLDKLLSF